MLPARKGLVEQQLRVLVTGGRDYQHRDRVFAALDQLAETHLTATGNQDILVIHGACCSRQDKVQLIGADRWAQEWAQEREYPYVGVPAKWAQIRIGAGRERNTQMRETWLPTNAVAFPGGPGTRHMTEVCRAAQINVWEPDKESSYVPSKRKRTSLEPTNTLDWLQNE